MLFGDNETEKRLEAVESELSTLKKLQRSDAEVGADLINLGGVLGDRITALEETISELTGTAPSMFTQVSALRQDVNQLITAAGCRKHEVPEVAAVPAVPAHTVIERIPRGSKE